MIELLIIPVVIIFLAVFFIKWLVRRFSANKLGISGRLVWTDHGRQTKPFFNKKYEVLGKPDLMYKTRSGILAVEYKSRHGPVFISDVVQAKCAALAARGEGYKITRLLLKTSSQEEYMSLPVSDEALYGEIKNFIALARNAKNGASMNPLPSRHKCRSCAYKYHCKHA
jgi:CRISPR/Cas system-associated exonuclease Cas4 (RecB family)